MPTLWTTCSANPRLRSTPTYLVAGLEPSPVTLARRPLDPPVADATETESRAVYDWGIRKRQARTRPANATRPVRLQRSRRVLVKKAAGERGFDSSRSGVRSIMSIYPGS